MDYSDYILKLSPKEFEVLKFSKSYRAKIRYDVVIPFNIDSKSTLEIGPGNNPLLKNATFMEYLPVDQLSKVLGYQQDKICCDIVGSITNIPADDKTFSATASVHVIEHTTDPLKAIREQIRVTKDLGYVLIIVPNFRANKFDFKREPLNISFFLEQHENSEKIKRNTQKQINEFLKYNPRPPAITESIRLGERRPHYYTYSAQLLEDLIYEACKLEKRNASLESSFYHRYSNDILVVIKLDTNKPLEIKGHIRSAGRQAEAQRKITELVSR